MEELLKLPDIAVSAALVLISSIALKIAIWSSVVILLLAIPDYIFQRRANLSSVRLSA
jgi:flagellar biosynthesis protein FlhB